MAKIGGGRDQQQWDQEFQQAITTFSSQLHPIVEPSFSLPLSISLGVCQVAGACHVSKLSRFKWKLNRCINLAFKYNSRSKLAKIKVHGVSWPLLQSSGGLLAFFFKYYSINLLLTLFYHLPLITCHLKHYFMIHQLQLHDHNQKRKRKKKTNKQKTKHNFVVLQKHQVLYC